MSHWHPSFLILVLIIRVFEFRIHCKIVNRDCIDTKRSNNVSDGKALDGVFVPQPYRLLTHDKRNPIIILQSESLLLNIVDELSDSWHAR